MILIKDQHVDEIENTLRSLSALAVAISREPYAAHIIENKSSLLSMGLIAAQLVELITQARCGYPELPAAKSPKGL